MILPYDLEHTDDINNRRFRVVTKPMTVRDGRLCDHLHASITRRKDADGKDIDDYLMLALLRYPTLFYGTHLFEVSYQVDDEWGDWQAVALTEELYQDLAEIFVAEWYQAVIDKNPQRDTTFENLKKFLEASFQTDSEGDLTSLPTNGKTNA